MARYRHKPTIVDAQRLRHEIKLVDEQGREKIGLRGDYLIHGVGDRQYIVDADVFEESYEPDEEPGR